MAEILLSPVESRDVDAQAGLFGLESPELMRRAGHAVACKAQILLDGSPRSKVLVLAGPGQNGSDGFMAASALAAMGGDVVVATVDQLVP